MNRRFKLKLPVDDEESRQCKQYSVHFGVDPIRIDEHTVDASPNLVGYSGMTYPRTPTVYQPIDHEKLEISYDGSFPCSYDLNDTHHYGDFGGVDLDGLTITYVPIRKLVDVAATFFPALLEQPEIPLGLWNQRYNGDLNKIRVQKPSLNTGFSLVSFFLQWKDARGVYSKYLNNAGARKNLKKILKEIQKSPSAAAKEIANQRLEYVYGTKQFVQDVAHIFTTLLAWKRAADKLADLANTPRYITKKLNDGVVPWLTRSASVPYSPFGLSQGPNGDYNSMSYIETWSLVSHCSCVYEYSCGEMRGFLARAGQFADALGVGLDPSIPWDAIPFSFVVDWFYNVGDWLHRQRKDWNKMRVLFAEYGTSAKFVNTKVVGYTWCGAADGFSTERNYRHVITKTYTRYVRDLAVLPEPDRPTLSNPENWSVPRIINATALAVQRLLKKGGVVREQRSPKPFYRSWYHRPYNRFFGEPTDPVR